MKKLFTSESVTEGHPDKLCDYISDSILDAYLEKDENSRVGCEVVAGKNVIFVTGEITSKGKVDVKKVVRNAIKEIGYFGDVDIDYLKCDVIVNLSKQSPDIALGVDNSKDDGDIGAGDQGIMFGYASNETKEYMPLAISLSHKLSARLTEVRKKGIIKDIGPDGKVQVTVEYGDEVRVDTVLISVQHKATKNLSILKEEIIKEVIEREISPKYLKNTRYLINPTGRFVIGGPLGDSGLTGRKIICDTYGGYARCGGGAFSGKDCTKVDRSASYMARFLAKNIVANGYAEKCELQLSYAIGMSKPISIYVDTFNTNKISYSELLKKINAFDLTPRGIIKYLDLKKPIYKKTTNYGHFGKEYLPWEKIVKM